MIDWNSYSALLIQGSDTALLRFFDANPGIRLSAIGYTFELGNRTPAFSLCANTHSCFRKTLEQYQDKWPNIAEDGVRWSSGDYEFCAGLVSVPQELGAEWCREYTRLHELVIDKSEMREQIYVGLVRICCKALADLVSRGTITDWGNIDFNIAEYNDSIEVIKERDTRVRLLIADAGTK